MTERDPRDEEREQMAVNVVFITADDLNWDSVGAYGCPVPDVTPNLDRLAAEGMRLTRGHVTVAVCQPSRSVLMTGRYPHENGAVGFEPINPEVPNLPATLKAAGYVTGILGKESHLAPREAFEWDRYVGIHDVDHDFGRNPQTYFEQTAAFLEMAVQESRPFFLMANSHDPHRPIAGSKEEVRRFGSTLPCPRHYSPHEVTVPEFLPDIPEVREEVAQYYSSVNRLDHSVGEILRAIDEAGVRDETLVMFLSDNGMAFPYAKTNCYLASTKTPWIIRWPGRVAEGSVDETNFVSGIDLMPTILDVCGVPSPEGMSGTTFAPVLSGTATGGGRGRVFTVFDQTSAKKDYPMRCVQEGRFGYIYNAWSDGQNVFENESQEGMTFDAMVRAAASDPSIAQRVRMFQYRVREELYDLAEDPSGLRNLAQELDYADQLQALRGVLRTHLLSVGDPVAATFERDVHEG
jgi:N-sulfoglucosamine sulfohydrolase